jgi:LPXTG-motif cell wall-anchored protein
LGIITMLFGALLVIAPSAGADHTTPAVYGVYAGNIKCVDAGTVVADDLIGENDLPLSGTFISLGETDGGLGGVTLGTEYTTDSGTPGDTTDDVLHVPWTSADPVDVVVVKQGSYSAVFLFDGAEAGTVYTALPDDADASENDYSHISFCERITTTVEIEKQVAGTAAPTDWEFDFSGLPDGGTSLTDEAPTTGAVEVDAGEFTVSETPQVGGVPTVSCENADVTANTGSSVTFEVAEGDDAKCTFVNTFDEAPPGTGNLVVVKDVVGTPPVDAEYDFSVDVPDSETDDTFSLEDGDSSDAYTALGAYDIEEIDTQGASSVGIVCRDDAEDVVASSTDSDVTVTLAEDDEITCIVTNTYTSSPPPPPPPPPPPIDEVEPSTLGVVKAVTGDVPEDGWSFSFNNDLLGDFELTDGSSSTSDEVDAGTYLITEAESDDADLTGIDCIGNEAAEVVDLDAGTVSVAVAEGEDVVCTFTNDFPEVGGVVTEPTVEEPAPAVAPPAVMGSQVVRSLPRTGSSSQTLATVGAMLMLFGAVVTVGSRRKLALER